MRAVVAATLTLTLPLAACTSTHQVSRETLRARIATADVVEFDNGARIDDLTPAEAETHPALLSSVRAVESRNRVSGALQGLGIGLATGAAGGAVFGYAGGQDCGSTPAICFDREASAIIGGMVFGTLGAAAGLVIGLAVGATDRYEAGPDHPSIAVSPTKGGASAGLTWSF